MDHDHSPMGIEVKPIPKGPYQLLHGLGSAKFSAVATARGEMIASVPRSEPQLCRTIQCLDALLASARGHLDGLEKLEASGQLFGTNAECLAMMKRMFTYIRDGAPQDAPDKWQ